MTQTLGPQTTTQLPDHTQLPETDGIPVKNFQEHPQTRLLSDTIEPVLDALHPDEMYAIGQDCGIYWKYEAEDPLRGAIAPDWFYVPGVPRKLDGEHRRSYVMWQEAIPPMIAIELASGDGEEERNSTPPQPGQKPGKFWVYERVLRIPYYGIYIVKQGKGQLEMYNWRDMSYQRMAPNAQGQYEITPLGVSLGIWHGLYKTRKEPEDWLRWWDTDGSLLPDYKEEAEAQKARADRLAERLQALGIDPDEL